MLKEYIESGFGLEEDLNCAETILYGANHVYGLDLDKKALKLAAGFGGGMGIGSTCGIITGGLMVLSDLFVEDRGHESNLIKKINRKFIRKFREKYGTIECKELKRDFCDPKTGCRDMIIYGGQILDEIIKEHGDEN